MSKIISPASYDTVMNEIASIQGSRAAIVILENEDGSTNYLRYNIDKEDAAEMLKKAYSLAVNRK